MGTVLQKADFFWNNNLRSGVPYIFCRCGDAWSQVIETKKFEFFIFHNNDTFIYFVLYKSINYVLSCILFYYILYTP